MTRIDFLTIWSIQKESEESETCQRLPAPAVASLAFQPSRRLSHLEQDEAIYPHGNSQNHVISKSLGHWRVWDRTKRPAAPLATTLVDLRCCLSCHKSTSQPDLKEHCRVTITEKGGRRREAGDGASKMKNNSQLLKRQGQKSFLPAACSSDTTNKSPLRHQSPGINSKTHTMDSDAFKAAGKDRQTELGQVWRERTKTTVQHVNIAKSFITQSLQNYDVNNFGKRGREQHPTCLFNITSVCCWFQKSAIVRVHSIRIQTELRLFDSSPILFSLFFTFFAVLQKRQMSPKSLLCFVTVSMQTCDWL